MTDFEYQIECTTRDLRLSENYLIFAPNGG